MKHEVARGRRSHVLASSHGTKLVKVVWSRPGKESVPRGSTDARNNAQQRFRDAKSHRSLEARQVSEKIANFFLGALTHGHGEKDRRLRKCRQHRLGCQ